MYSCIYIEIGADVYNIVTVFMVYHGQFHAILGHLFVINWALVPLFPLIIWIFFFHINLKQRTRNTQIMNRTRQKRSSINVSSSTTIKMLNNFIEQRIKANVLCILPIHLEYSLKVDGNNIVGRNAVQIMSMCRDRRHFAQQLQCIKQ